MALLRICYKTQLVPKRFYVTGTNIVIPNLNVDAPTIGRTNFEQEFLFAQKPDQPEDPHLLKVSILGKPNAGKSTLVNRLMKRRISATSRKAHTTRGQLTGCLTDQNKQVVILDAPGIVPLHKKKEHKLEKKMITDPHSSLWEADLICVVHDVSDPYSLFKLDPEVLKCLFVHPEKESILVLNKIDRLKQKKTLLDVVPCLTGGYLGGHKFFDRERDAVHKKIDLEKIYELTANKMNLKLDSGEKDAEYKKLVDEIKQCEKELIRIIKEKGDDDDNIVNELMKIDENKRVSLDTLKGKNEISPYKTIDDISAPEFKQDLMETTNWHLYYEKLSKLDLLTRGRKYWPHFNQVFMISALDNTGVDDLKRYLFSQAKPGNWMFSRNFVTDQMPYEMAEMCVREKMLELLPEEIPYELKLAIEYWQIDENDTLNIVMNVIPRSMHGYKRDVSTLLRGGGKMIKEIADQARQEIANTFRCEVSLKLIVVTK